VNDQIRSINYSHQWLKARDQVIDLAVEGKGKDKGKVVPVLF
jgi:hypothetical protein